MAAKPPRRSRSAPRRSARPVARRPQPDPRADAYAAYLCRYNGRRLRECREAAGLSAYALARLVGTVTAQTIRNLEDGRCPNGCLTATLGRIAWHLDVPAAAFYPPEESIQKNWPNTFG